MAQDFCTMAQNVYMAFFAFFIPLKRVRRKYRNLRASQKCVETPFAFFPKAQCYYKALEDAKHSSVVCSRTFYYSLRYNGRDALWGQVTVKSFLLDCEQVDPHFGTKENIEELIGKVHDRGMSVVADLNMWVSLTECLISAINNVFVLQPIASSHSLYKEAKLHLARYPTDFQLWLSLDNHDLNRLMYECGQDKTFL